MPELNNCLSPASSEILLCHHEVDRTGIVFISLIGSLKFKENLKWQDNIPLNVYDCHLVQFVIENVIIAFLHHQHNTFLC